MERIHIRTTIYSGVDSLERLEQIEKKKIWLICDKFLVENGSVSQILNRMTKKNEVILFHDVVPDPPLNVVAKGVALATSIQPDVMIAYGGGSAIDTAKGIIYFARMIHCLEDVTFIAIPTTSGTGSEVTSATVITDQQVKHPLIDDRLVPDEVILCPTLTVSVPPSVTANTGMDVLTHAIEAYVAKNASAYSDALAEKACELVFESLVTCYEFGEDLEARSKMQQASNLAGTAFNLAGLGMNHAIAHQLGGTFHIPHGLANALILTKVIQINSANCICKLRYAILARKLNLVRSEESEQTAVDLLIQQITKMQKQLQIPLKLRDCKVEYQDLVASAFKMSENALQDNCRIWAPCIYSKDQIVNLLLSMY